MSPQSSANQQSDIITCSSLHALHKIDSDSSGGASLGNSLVHKDVTSADGGASTSPLVRKRSYARNAPPATSKDQPFLSSYGSAFLSGIFADIAHVSDDSQPTTFCQEDGTAHDCVSEPVQKRARKIASLVCSTEGTVSEDPHPSVVSPRPYTSALTIHRINDHVRELQDMAFPSFPQMPVTVSAVSSCSSTTLDMLMMEEEFDDGDNEEGLAYGWFVSTDEETDAITGPPTSFFLPDMKPSLAFKALAAPMAGNQDAEVQQALAADTVDDVLGDLF